MTSETDTASEPARHYDTVVGAWGYLLQEDLHYGYFETGSEPLVVATNALTNQMLALAKLSTGQQVLDIGCGTGKAACRIAQEFDCQVTGISPSTQCITNATAKAAELGQEALVQFRIGDGMAPDFPDASFDCTWVMESSHLMQDKTALIRECARLLKPGGRFMLCDVMLGRKLSLSEVIDHRDDFLLLKDVFGRAVMEPLEFYEQQCGANGLIVEHSRNISAETLPTFDRWHDNSLQNRATVSEMIGDEACKQFSDSCYVLRNFWESAVLGYGIISALKADSV